MRCCAGPGAIIEIRGDVELDKGVDVDATLDDVTDDVNGLSDDALSYDPDRCLLVGCSSRLICIFSNP